MSCSFRSAKGNDSSHVLVAFEVAKDSANSPSSKKVVKLGVKALEENYKTEVRGVDMHHDWGVSGYANVRRIPIAQDAIGRTAHVGVYTGAVGSPYLDRKNESDHVAGILAPNHSPNDVPSTWVMKQQERKKKLHVPTKASKRQAHQRNGCLQKNLLQKRVYDSDKIHPQKFNRNGSKRKGRFN